MKWRAWSIYIAAVCVLAGCSKNETIQESELAPSETTMVSDVVTTKEPEATEEVQESIIIEDQSFDVTLDGWGDVKFVSYEPMDEDHDASFQLLQDGEIVYTFQDSSVVLENEQFEEVSAVTFRDYNNDGKKDIILLCKYRQMDPEQEYTKVRLYTQVDGAKEFSSDALLEEYLMKNYYNETVDSVLEGIESYNDYENAMENGTSIEEQLQLIVDQKDLWLEQDELIGEDYLYAVTDLDHNGRLEIIASMVGGTGFYTTSDYYEVNEAGDGLTRCESNLVEGDSEPDIGLDEVPAFFDETTGITYYIFSDYLKADVTHYYETLSAVSLQQGKLVIDPLASSETVYEAAGEGVSTYWNADNEEIDQEAYTRMPDETFQALTKQKASFGWTNSTGEKELLELLTDSYEQFKTVDQ